MIAFAEPRSESVSHPLAPTFEELLPAIQQHARQAFRRAPASEREELVAAAVADAYCAYARLVARGKADLAYARPLAEFAIRRVRCGRSVGTPLNVNDVTSWYCQRANGITVGRLDHYEQYRQEWKEVLVEDPKAGPADIAAARIDFAEWLKSLGPRIRKIAKLLATGESTNETARKFGVSAGRISQLRRGLEEAWQNFQGEPVAA